MYDYSQFIDKPITARAAETPDLIRLTNYLKDIFLIEDSIEIEQFAGGYSNLTFLIKTANKEYVLRKPPKGANIKTAHDMGREFNVLNALQSVYKTIPQPIIFCTDETIVGSPFYIMQRVKGVILRNKIPQGIDLNASLMKGISESTIDNLAALHSIDVHTSGLINLGKPDGYTNRQITGWINRYFAAETEAIEKMNKTADWMQQNIPTNETIAFIHNDYKYDNLVLDPQNLTNIIAVLDWEMATIGNPLMDLGTTLAYWAQASDSAALKPFNLTWLPGNLTRQQVVERYAIARNIDLPNMLFYYVFGCFKIAVIVQQIYARYKKGLTYDTRFAGLIHVVHACSTNAQIAINNGTF